MRDSTNGDTGAPGGKSAAFEATASALPASTARNAAACWAFGTPPAWNAGAAAAADVSGVVEIESGLHAAASNTASTAMMHPGCACEDMSHLLRWGVGGTSWREDAPRP